MFARIEEAESRFYVAYGRALSAWSYLESALGEMFIHLSGMRQLIGMSVFYSANSFAGRIDMLRACIDHAKTIPAGKEFLWKLAAKASNYSETRNRLAHDFHAVEMDRATRTVTRRVIRRAMAKSEVTEEQMRWATQNFTHLGHLSLVSWKDKKPLREPELSLALLDLLPQAATDLPPNLKEVNSRLGELSLS